MIARYTLSRIHDGDRASTIIKDQSAPAPAHEKNENLQSLQIATLIAERDEQKAYNAEWERQIQQLESLLATATAERDEYKRKWLEVVDALIELEKKQPTTPCPEGEQWRCPNDTDGDGDCHQCHKHGGCTLLPTSVTTTNP